MHDLPLPCSNQRSWALFLDVDAIAEALPVVQPRPARARELGRLFERLHEKFLDACALMTAKDVGFLDDVFAWNGRDAAGRDGAEIRIAGGVEQADPDAEVLARATASLLRCAARERGALVAIARGSVALHYGISSLNLVQGAVMAEMAAGRDNGSLLFRFHRNSVELAPRRIGKDRAVARFLQHVTYRNLCPVFVGLCRDESAFQEVGRQQGVAIQVGPGHSGAHYKVHDRRELLRWLSFLLEERVVPLRAKSRMRNSGGGPAETKRAPAWKPFHLFSPSPER